MLETGYEKFYGEDPLHMNLLGYSLLSKLIRDGEKKLSTHFDEANILIDISISFLNLLKLMMRLNLLRYLKTLL